MRAAERLALGVVGLRHMLVSLSDALEFQFACKRVPAEYSQIHAVACLVSLQSLRIAEKLVALGTFETLWAMGLSQVAVQGAHCFKSGTALAAFHLLLLVVFCLLMPL